MSSELATQDRDHLPDTARAVESVSRRLEMIRDLMLREMKEGVDYGTVPGTNSKPTLLKAGAEKLCVLFRFGVRYETEKHWLPGDHLMVESKCRIHDMNDHFMGEASALCSTRESKYAWRKAERTCPECGKPAIIKGKVDFGGGFICWTKKGGCGCKYEDNDPRIVGQTVGRVPNPDIPDSWNTIVRIAEKRSLVAAARLVSGASSLFDEETPDQEGRDPEPEPVEPAGEKPAKAPVMPTGKAIDDPVAWSRFMDAADPQKVNQALANANKEVGGITQEVRESIKAGVERRGWLWDDKGIRPKPAPQQTPQQPPPGSITDQQALELAALLGKAGVTIEDFFQEYQIARVGELPAVHYADAMARLTTRYQERLAKGKANSAAEAEKARAK